MNDTVELLQTLIRNRCVNDGTSGVGRGGAQRGRPPELHRGSRRDHRTVRAHARPGVDRRPHRGHRSRRTVAVPDGAHRRRAGQPRRVGATIRSAARCSTPARATEVWGRGAVDMFNLTASMAVTFRDLARSGFRPSGDLIYFAVADEEAGSAHGARWMADNHPDAIRADVRADRERRAAQHVGRHQLRRDERRREGRRLAAAHRARHTGPRVGAVPWRQRAGEGGGRGAAPRRLPARRRGSTNCGRTGSPRSTSPTSSRPCCSTRRRSTTCSTTLPSVGAASHLHACTHTTFSPNLVDGNPSGNSRMKVNVIPDTVVVEVDIRTLPGEGARRGRRPPAGRARRSRRSRRVRGDHERRRLDQPHRHAAVGRARSGPSTTRSRRRRSARSSSSASPTPASTATSAPIAYGAGLFSPSLDANEYGSRFHGHNERIDVESLSLTTQFFHDVVTDSVDG